MWSAGGGGTHTATVIAVEAAARPSTPSAVVVVLNGAPTALAS